MPAVLALYDCMEKRIETVKYLRRMCTTLRDSLMRRFQGLFVQVNMAVSQNHDKEPFSNKVYAAASVLDPNLKLAWVDEDVHIPSRTDTFDTDVEDLEAKEDLKQEIQGKLLQENACDSHSSCMLFQNAMLK